MADIKTNQSKVYNALKGMGFSGIGANEAEFAAKMSNPKNREKVYNALSSKGYKGIGKDQAAFDSLIYQAQQPVSQPAQPNQTQTLNYSSVEPQPVQKPQQKPKQPAKDELTGKPISPYVTGEGAHQPFIGAPEQFEPTYDLGNGQRRKVSEDEKVALGTSVTPAVQQVVDANGNVVKENVITPVEPQEVAYDRYLKESRNSITPEQQNQQRLNDVNQKLAKANEAEQRETLRQYAENPYLFVANAMNMAGGSAPGGNMQMANNQTQNRKYLEARQQLLSDNKRIIDEVRQESKEEDGIINGLKQAVRNVAKSTFKGSTWDFGATDLNTQTRLLEAASRADNGEATNEDYDLLNDFALSSMINSNYANQLSGWAKAGQVTGESLPFMLEMAMNPASGIGQAAQKGLVRMAVNKYGKKWVKDHAKSVLASKIATRVAGDIIGGQAMAASTGMLRTIADAESRMTGRAIPDVDNKGNIIYGGHTDSDSAATAFTKAWVANGIENSSEMWGEYLAPVTGLLGKAIGKAAVGKAGREALNLTGRLGDVSLNKAQRFIYDVTSRKGMGAISQGLDNFLKKTQWHGLLGEYVEEELGNLANAATVGDMTFDDAEDTGIFNLQQHLDTFSGVALMGGFMSALHTGGYALDRYNNRMSKIEAKGNKMFADWDKTKTIINSVLDDSVELNNTLTTYLGDKNLTPEAKRVILDYTAKALEKKGADMAEYQPRMDHSTTRKEGDGYVVDSMDVNGNVISSQTFKTEDEAKAFEGELKMRQQSRDMKDYLEMSGGLSYGESSGLVEDFLHDWVDDDKHDEALAEINDPNTEIGKQFREYKNQKVIDKARSSREAIAAFEEQNGWAPGTVRELTESDPMQMDETELAMADQAREFLKGLAYPAGEVHIELSQQEGADAASEVVEQVAGNEGTIDPNNNAGQQITEQWYAAQGKRHMAFVENEDLMQEVTSMEQMGLSPQEILSSLDTFSPQERQILTDYYNSQARFQSFLNTAQNKIDEEAANSRQRHTMKGTINGTADVNNVYTISDGTNTYYLVSGNITTDPATGQITGSDSGLIIGMDLDGSFVNIGDTNGYSVMPVTQSLDQFEEEERIRLQEQVTGAIDPNGTMAPQPQQVQQPGAVGGEAGGTNATGANEPPTPEAATPETPQGTALDRIPKDEGGNPLYEQASAEDTYDALVEQVGENTAKILAKRQLDKATKALEKLNKKMEKGEFEGTTLQEQIEGSKKLQQEIDTEQGRINFWNSVLAVPNNRRLNEINNRPATPTSGTVTPPTPLAGGEESVPDWSVDKASDARARGYRMTNGHRVDRPQPIADKVEGNEVEVKFDKNEDPVKGFQVVVMDAGSLVPSHVNGQRNILFFIDEAQPKDRTDVDSEASSNRIAEKINPEEITGGVTAYTGSPVVNTRGEVIQGNNRTIGLQKMWGNAAYEESQKKYKQYLIDHAEEFGIDPAAIEQMQSPVLVRMVDVTDEEAIRLGQKTAANTESGGVERIDPMRTIQSMGDNIRIFMNLLFGNEIEGQTLMGMIAENGVDVLKWLNDGRNHPKYISDTQYQSCFDKKGNLTEEAKTDLRKIVEGMLFAGAPDRLPEMFYGMPTKAQNAILSTFWRDAQSPEEAKILNDIQDAIEAFAVISGASEQFRNAKDVNAARTAVKDLQKQTQLFGNTETVLEKFSNFALELAIMFKGDKQNTIRDYFNGYYDAVQGKGGSLFESAATKTKSEAINEIFGIDINEETNGEEGSNTLGSNNQDGEAGQPGRNSQPGVGKSVEGGEQPATGGRGSSTGTLSEREQYIADHPLTEAEIDAANASPAQKILAKQYLNSKDDFVSEMAKAAYTFIYNKKVAAQNQGQQPTAQEQPTTPSAPASEQPSRPRSEAPARPETPPTPPSTGGQQGGSQNSAQAAAQARMAAALAKLKKHGKKPSDNQGDAYSIENLTPEQIEDMFEVVEAGAELGYTLLDGVQTKEEWIAQMREAISEPLKDATGYNDTEVDELLNDMWNYPYAVEGEVKTVSEWAAEKGINVNEIENGTGESNGDNTPTELPGSTSVGGSTEAGVEQGGNNEGNAGTSGETVSGTNTAGSNSGTQSRGETNGSGQRSGGTGSTRGKTRGTRQSEQPGNLFGEDEGNGTNDTPGIEQGGTAATVPEGGLTVPQTDGKPKKPLADITQEKTPYKPASIGGKFAIGSVIPSGIADSIANAFKRLKEKFFKKKSMLDFVREELGYKTNEEMLSDFESGKTDGLAAEQVDAVALAIGKMKDGKSFIVGDMTGVGKGRVAAALIRWGLKHGKKVLFVTERSNLFSAMNGDLKDIGCDYLPFVTNSDTNANITDDDGNKVIPKPMPAAQKALWQSGSDKLPKDKKGRQYDFVMTTYSQVNGNEKGDKKKAEWLRDYAKDAIVIMDESHNASGESNTGAYFREVVENAGGVTFLSATYAKRPDNMLLYAIKSSMSAINMPVQSFLDAIKEYGVAMQELMASALFGSGEMIRRERDMSDVKTTWTDPKEIYSEDEYEQCRKTSDKTMDLINDIIQFQRDYVNPIVADHEKQYDQQNAAAALIGGVQTHAGNTSYKSQVSNITNLMVYAMKAKKAAEMAIEQIKQGKKPVIAVSNTMGSYIDELEGDIPEAGFRPIFEKGIRFSLRYVIADYAPGDDGKYHKVKGSERVFDATDELSDAGERALENLRRRVEEYMGDTDKVDLSLSPIDLVKQMIADAGYNCGEITGRSTQLVKKEGGGYTKTTISQNRKEAERKFNGGSKDKPIPEDEQYQALILNVAGATGISLHSSKKFGNQQPRTMIILQPNADVNKEVQMRGRIDRTGQVHRGEYFYMSSPIPAEQKITMMLKQKLASLDAQSVGTKKVSSNKVEGQDMDNKYGDEVCYNYLTEHLNDVNAFLENGLTWNKKTREWEGRPGLLYDVLKDLQRMPCEMQEKVINELSQRYADQIEYLNQNGINDLETTTMDLEAVTIDKATFVKGKDSESENEFAHDTTIERVEVNVLKKPMRSADIKKKMKELDALDEDGLPKEGVLGQTDEKVKAMMEQKIADRQARYDEQEVKFEEKVRSEHPKKPEQSDEEYEAMIKGWPSLVEMQNKHKADIAQYSADLQSQYNDVYKAAMYLKPGRPYLVPLTDDISDNGALMYGRFLGFQLKNGDPRQVQAVFAVKDSRSMITIPVVNKSKVIDKIINERNDMDISELERDKETYDQLPMEQRAKNWDEWWDKMIPKNTNRQIRYMITGNVLQACGSLGKYKGQIITFSRKNKDTGEITLERGMLLAENFDPENFQVRRAVEKKDVWDSYDEVKDDRSGVSCHREGSNMVVKFEKRKGEKLVDHPAQKDQELKDLAMNGEIRPSGKSALLCVIKEDNVEKALEHLYKEYGYTKEELFVMPDSTEKPDAIVRTNRPWQEIIDELSPKYGNNRYAVDNKIRQMLKRYKMDVNNEGLKNDIREAVQLRQAYLRKNYADKESNRLAWEVLILDEAIERNKDDKDFREDCMRKKEAILEELEFRGFKGTALHLEQGKMNLDDVRELFDSLNKADTPEGKAKKALFEKVMAKVSKLPMEIFLNEKIDNDTGGFAGGRIVNYNWKYMNADYIADQAKADTILHELIHTVTAYADRCVEDGLEHLLDQDMIDAINELHSIFDAIKNDPTFTHDGAKAYGLTNVREMLSEAGSNSEFRNDLKKTGLWARLKAGFLAFFGIKKGVDMPGAKQVNAFDQIMERLDYLIENFKQEAWEEYYKGTKYGGYGYKRQDAQKIETSDPMEAIEQAADSWRRSVKDSESSLSSGSELGNSSEKDVPLEQRTLRSYTDKDGNYHRGIEEELAELESDIARAGAENAGTGEEGAAVREDRPSAGEVNRLRKQAAKLRAEISRRENEKQELRKEYDIDEKGNISFENLSRMFNDLNSNKVLGKLFDKVASVLKNLGVEFRFTDNLQGNIGGRAIAFVNVTFYNWDAMTRDVDNQEKARILLHEMIHNVTSQILVRYKNPSLGKLTKAQEWFAKEIISIYNKVKAERPLRENGKEPYGLQDEEEMIAELANPEFRDMLARIPYKENISIWQGIKQCLSKLFGTNTALDSLEKALDDILESYDENENRIYRKQREGWERGMRNAGYTDDYVDFWDNMQGIADKYSVIDEDPLNAIRNAANRWKRDTVNNGSGTGSPADSAKKIYHERINTKSFVITEAFQDAMASLKIAINAIAKYMDIPDSQNPYIAENIMHGKVKNQMDDYNRRFRDVIEGICNRICDVTGWNFGDIDRMVYTKSGLERNREFYVRDWFEKERKKADADKDALDQLERAWLGAKEDAYQKLMTDPSYNYSNYLADLTSFIKKNINSSYNPSKHDYSGFRAMFGEDYDEADIIAELLANEATVGEELVNSLWAGLNAANDYALERYRQAGMRSDEQIDKIKGMFNFYVPMRGFKEDMGEDVYQYMTGKDQSSVNRVGGLLKHAKGRGSEAEFPISTIFTMGYKTIADCEQNLVNQKLYRLCQSNPNDLIVLSDSWARLNEATGEWYEDAPIIPDDATEEQVRLITLDWEKQMKDLANQGKAMKIRGKANFDYKPMDKKNKAQHVVEVRINGQKKRMTVVGNPRLAMALNGNLRFEGALGKVSKAYARLKNFMAQTFTAWSPTFSLRNMFRDWTHFRMILSVREGEGYAHAAAKYYKETLPRPYHGRYKNGQKKVGMVELFKKYREGTLDMNKEVERDFKDFMDNGGITGYVFMKKLNDIQREIEKSVKSMRNKKSISGTALEKLIHINDKTIGALLDTVEAYNEAVENNARFATFRASRHYAGRTKSRAAYDAKEITVNFNRKGAGKKTAGFKSSDKDVELAANAAGFTSQVLGEGRVFFNATLQAIATTFKMFRNADGSFNWPYIRKWSARYASIPFAFGFAMPLINKALVSMFGGDGDDDDPYANLPEWTRRNNLCFYIGNNNFITIPVGQELAAFLALGDIAAGLIYRENLMPIDRDWDDEMMGVLNTFSPIEIEQKVTKGGITEDPIDEFVGRTFSVLAPLVSIQQNLGWTGRPIYREDKYENDEYTPEYQMVYSGVNPVLKSASKGLHELGGGDDVVRGKEWSEVNPAKIQYLWEQYTGGPGKTASGIISAARDLKEWLSEGDPEFNIRKVEGIKALFQQGDDRTAYYRTQAKYRKYREDAKKLKDEINGYENAIATDPMLIPKLEKLSASEDYVRMSIVTEADKQLSKLYKAANKAEGKERKELRQLYNKAVKEVVDLLDEVGR